MDEGGMEGEREGVGRREIGKMGERDEVGEEI